MVFVVSFVNLDFEENQKKKCDNRRRTSLAYDLFHSFNNSKTPLNSFLYLNNDLFIFLNIYATFAM